MRLADLQLIHAHVGYGKLGVAGDLGYEGKRVSVQGAPAHHALSAHPPSRIGFDLGGRFGTLRCRVALNDDVPAGRSHADFSIVADGRVVASAHHVVAGDPPREMVADVRGARCVDLDISTSRWEHCHAVWLDPELDPAPPGGGDAPLLDCLARAEILTEGVALRAARVIATVVSPGYTELADDMLGSLRANGGCHDAALVVFTLDGDEACAGVAAKHGATVIPARAHARINATSKALLYTIARVVEAEQYLCLDADMLVLGDLRPLFSALDVLPPASILACREGNGHGLSNLGDAFQKAYWGTREDAAALGLTPSDLACPLVINDGLFAGTRGALLALDDYIRGLSPMIRWVDQRRDNWWRNQFVMNLALARLGCGVEIDASYNLQLHTQDVSFREDRGRLEATWRGRPVNVLHFSGVGRRKYPEHKNRYSRVPDPLPGGGGGDSYARFLDALRRFVGRSGRGVLRWSFYGTADARGARVADPSTFPLLALLHYLVRANGCTRVIETGTARGVSAACLASAVAHRPGAEVVTLDTAEAPGRHALWAELPDSMRACIEERAVDSRAGLAAALAAGERYHAALLDSLHTGEHVWEELELAFQIVCPGGLILVHDAVYPHGTVGQALDRARAAGYDVTRLWVAEGGEREDDGLGLAVIENRRRGE